MKFGKILLPLVLLGLAACGSTPASTTSDPDSQGGGSAGTSVGASVGASVGTSVGGGASEQAASMSVDFSGIAKDTDQTDTVVNGWVVKASKYSYAGAVKLQYADNHIVSPTISKTGALEIKIKIFTTGDGPAPWELKIIGLNAAGGEVEVKTPAFADLPNTIENAAVKSWTFTNEGDAIKNIKVVYSQKGNASNVGIMSAEIV